MNNGSQHVRTQRRRLTPEQRRRIRRRRRIKKLANSAIVILVLLLLAAVICWLIFSDPKTAPGKNGSGAAYGDEQGDTGSGVLISPSEVAVAVSQNHSAWLRDGRVYVAGTIEYDQQSVAAWQDIIQISASDSHLVALDKYGRVLAAGRNSSGQCRVHGMENVAFVAAGPECTICVMRDGSVQVYGLLDGDIRDGLVSAEKVSMVDIGKNHVVARHIDGTVSAFGSNSDGECEVSSWNDVVWVSAGDGFTVALTGSGTALFTGDNGYCQQQCTKWTDLSRLEAGRTYVVGVRSDGTMLAIGRNGMGQCELDGWSGVVSVAAGYDHTVAMRSDGTMLAAGYNGDGQCDVTAPQ